MTGNKLDGEKYYNHSGYAGGLRVRSARVMKEKYTSGMGRACDPWYASAYEARCNVQRKHLFVYKGAEHPHAAQKPVELVIKG